MESNERWLWSAKDAYFSTGDNITWNPNGPSNLKPIYSDNPYWTFYENYETDTRSRYFGNVALDNKINDWLSAMVSFYLILTVNYKKRINVEVLTYHHIQDVTAMFLNTIMMQC
jgi:hypothetical protein